MTPDQVIESIAPVVQVGYVSGIGLVAFVLLLLNVRG